MTQRRRWLQDPDLSWGYAGAIPGFTPLAPCVITRNYANTMRLSSARTRLSSSARTRLSSSARTRLWSGRTRRLYSSRSWYKMVCWVLGWAEGICANMNSEAPFGRKTRTYPGLRWCNTRIYAISHRCASTRNYANYTMKGRSEVNLCRSLLYRVYLPSMDVDSSWSQKCGSSADGLHFLLTSSHTSQALVLGQPVWLTRVLHSALLHAGTV